MKRMAKWSLGMLILGLTVSGCQPFKKEDTIKLPSLGIHRINIDAPNHNQDVKVEADSEGVEINVYIALGKHADAVENKLVLHQEPDKTMILESQLRTTKATVQAKIPAKESFSVFFAWPNKNTTVKYIITGR
jgi:hypothetical protein